MKRTFLLIAILLLSSVYFISQFGYAQPWTDEELNPYVTVKSLHIQELRSAADQIRLNCGLPGYPYEEISIDPGRTTVKAVHIEEVREAVGEIYTSTGRNVPEFEDPSPIPDGTTIRGAHFIQLREAIENAVICGDGDCTKQCGENCANCQADCGKCCGNGEVDRPNEDCDGNNLDGATCVSLGFLGGGTLSCTGDCHYFTENCLLGPECGNDEAELGEDCDGSDLNETTCIDLGYAGGDLACTGDCYFDETGCIPAAGNCGNGKTEPPEEECDSPDMNQKTCNDFGFDGGILKCMANCKFNKEGCYYCNNDGVCDPKEECATCDDCCAGCGNGKRETGEDCDQLDMDGQTCQSQGFSGGGDLRCTGDCAFDYTDCVCGRRDVPTVCGNAAIGPADFNTSDGAACPEKCKTDFTGRDPVYGECAEGGWRNVSQECYAACGDGEIDEDIGEECDGTSLGGATCATEGYDQGQLRCSGDCFFDTTACYNCDWLPWVDLDCGLRRCAADKMAQKRTDRKFVCDDEYRCVDDPLCEIAGCTYGPYEDAGCGPGQICGETSCGTGSMCQKKTAPEPGCEDIFQCVSDPEKCTSCPDGVKNGSEECDTNQFGDATCESEGFEGGSLRCTYNCEIDTTFCCKCGNNEKEDACGEICDGSDLDGMTCSDRGYDGGALACAIGCGSFDYSGCYRCGDDRCDVPYENHENCPEDCRCSYGEWVDLGCGINGCSPLQRSYKRSAPGQPGCEDLFRCESDDSCIECGNNEKETGEVCDGSDLDGESCLSLGFEGGTLACAADCLSFDETGCCKCRNNEIEPVCGEVCDGSKLNGKTCADFGFDGGVLRCGSDCQAFDTTGCYRCGDGVCDSPYENYSNCPEDCVCHYGAWRNTTCMTPCPTSLCPVNQMCQMRSAPEPGCPAEFRCVYAAVQCYDCNGVDCSSYSSKNCCSARDSYGNLCCSEYYQCPGDLHPNATGCDEGDVPGYMGCFSRSFTEPNARCEYYFVGEPPPGPDGP